jgi:hypothetical protein
MKYNIGDRVAFVSIWDTVVFGTIIGTKRHAFFWMKYRIVVNVKYPARGAYTDEAIIYGHHIVE